MQRIHAVLFHQGAHCPGVGLGSVAGQAELAVITATELSAAGQLQVATALEMLTGLQDHLDKLHQNLVNSSGHLTGGIKLSV